MVGQEEYEKEVGRKEIHFPTMTTPTSLSIIRPEPLRYSQNSVVKDKERAERVHDEDESEGFQSKKRKLKDLLALGLLNEEEYDRQRKIEEKSHRHGLSSDQDVEGGHSPIEDTESEEELSKMYLLTMAPSSRMQLMSCTLLRHPRSKDEQWKMMLSQMHNFLERYGHLNVRLNHTDLPANPPLSPPTFFLGAP